MVNVLIPMGGKGSRFAKAGYTFPKPLVEVLDDGNMKPMIQMVVDNLGIKGTHIFLVLKEHSEKYQFKYLLPLVCKDNPCKIVEIEEFIKDGPAKAVLQLTKDLINNDEELILSNSDQWLDWIPDHFLKFLRERDADGGIATFYGTHPKWSFAKVEEGTGIITEVAEKKPISTVATCGIYYFKRGRDFIKAIEDMIEADDRTNGEFYICPSFNYMIKDGRKVLNYPVGQMLGTGTPEDLEIFTRFQMQRANNEG